MPTYELMAETKEMEIEINIDALSVINDENTEKVDVDGNDVTNGQFLYESEDRTE